MRLRCRNLWHVTFGERVYLAQSRANHSFTRDRARLKYQKLVKYGYNVKLRALFPTRPDDCRARVQCVRPKLKPTAAVAVPMER